MVCAVICLSKSIKTVFKKQYLQSKTITRGNLNYASFFIYIAGSDFNLFKPLFEWILSTAENNGDDNSAGVVLEVSINIFMQTYITYVLTFATSKECKNVLYSLILHKLHYNYIETEEIQEIPAF